MKIYQLVPNLAYGDGVGNDILAIDRLLKSRGYETNVYAIVIDKRIPPDVARPFQTLPRLQEEDIVIFHLAVGSEMNHWIRTCRCRKIIRYHNITPAGYFRNYSPESMRACAQGLEEIKNLRNVPDFCLADSEFNRADLISYGYKPEIEVLPILIPFSDYEREPDPATIRKYRDGMTNLLFTGRIVPNKKQEDVILSFYYYQKYYNPDSRLFLVGSFQGMEPYYQRLLAYVQELGVKNVIFTGHISFREILAYYHLADVFLCMSQHEGFCIPLVEAMYFEIPIVAADYAAVGDTLGSGGMLLPSNECLTAAGCIDRIIRDELLAQTIRKNQKTELERFSADRIGERFLSMLESFMKEGSGGT